MATVLLADDDAILRDMYKMRLIKAGYVVHEAVNGQDVLDKVKETLPDLIILDVMMPKMNGLDVLKFLRSGDKTKHIPVIMLTAIMQDVSQLNDAASKADAYLIKSEVMPEQVVEQVGELLAKTPKA